MDFDPVILAFGVASAIPAYLALESGPAMVMIVFILSMTLLFFARTAGVTDSLAVLTNPFVSFFVIISLAFIYFSIEGGSFWPILAKSLGAGFVWGAISMVVFNIWNL